MCSLKKSFKFNCLPIKSAKLTLLPASMSSFDKLRCPFWAAKCRGINLWEFTEFTLASCSSRSSTTWKWSKASNRFCRLIVVFFKIFALNNSLQYKNLYFEALFFENISQFNLLLGKHCKTENLCLCYQSNNSRTLIFI